MKEKRPFPYSIVLHCVEIIYSLVLLAWLVVPLFFPKWPPVTLHNLPFVLYNTQSELFLFIITAVMVYSIPLFGIYTVASVFLKKRFSRFMDPERFISIALSIIFSTFILLAMVFYIIKFAINLQFFATISVYTYAITGATLCFNIGFVIFLIRTLNKRSATYREYLEFKKETSVGTKNKFVAFFKRIVRSSIQKRLVISFVGLILIVISILSVILLGEFRKNLVSAVIHSGTTLAERCASIIKANPADEIAITDFIDIEKKKNAKSDFAFNSITYFKKQGRQNLFTAANSTDPKIINREITKEHRAVSDSAYFSNAAKGTFEFVSVVKLSGVILGYTVVIYEEDLIYAAFFQTMIKVIFFCLFFVYASAFLVYIFGRNIANPILFLRMSVHRISNTLSQMMKGKVRVQAELLEFQDKVTTKDEIKSLSTEFGNMTTVLRGIIPYVSASTLMHAERSTPLSTKREMTFLFTDIRGFTTLCEGLEPDKVVAILNKYLDLQASIIIRHKGDIDKFVGDEIMASFDGPSREQNACAAGLEIWQAMDAEREMTMHEGDESIAVGIGIHTGPVVFGSVGAKERMDFTSIGDTVNLAARVEGANKTYGTRALITEAVFKKIKDAFICREIDLLTVKGKTKPVRIYEILAAKGKAPKAVQELKRDFEAALEFYRDKKWKEAAALFQKNNDSMKDEASRVFLRRIELFKVNPPPKNWDGVFAMTVK